MDKLSLDDLQNFVENQDVKSVRLLFQQYNEIDISEVANDLPIQDVLFIMRTVKSENGAEFFAHLDDEVQEKLINAFSDKDIFELLEAGFNDDIADYLEDMPANVVSRVLKTASPETRSAINQLLNYKDGTAGSIMTTEYLTLGETMTCEQALKTIRREGKKKETVYTIFIIDKKRNLLGTLDLDDLVFAEPEVPIKDIMNHNYQIVHTAMSQQEVANVVRRYSLGAIGVLNSDERLSGVITVDDIIDVLSEESAEDIARLGRVGSLQNSYLDTGVFKLALKCLPWILVLLVLGVFSAMVLDKFQQRLLMLPVLSAFIPMVMGTGGNSSNQSIALMVRGLALEEFKPRDYFKILWKEIRVALIVAGVVALFVTFWVVFEMYVHIVTYPDPSIIDALSNGTIFWMRFRVGGSIGLSLFITVIISKIIGVSLPLLSAAFKRDPALASGPIATTVLDVVSLLVFFAVCILILPEMQGA